jgi:hypothetical protein
VKALENEKAGKVTAVVAVMHLYGNVKSSSINANAKIGAKKTKLESKLKKLDLNWVHCLLPPPMHVTLRGVSICPHDKP